ncbi:MAG: hypothetical protein U0414_27570 [Polyangiaceae bacterium]
MPSLGRSVDATANDTPIEDPWLLPKPPPPKKSRRGLWISLIAGGVVLLGSGGAATALILTQGDTPEPKASATSNLARDEVAGHTDVDRKQTQAAPPASQKPQAPPNSWRETRVEVVGSVKVVDLGGDEATLSGALQTQMKAAKADKKEVLVLVMADNCDPCKKLREALSDPAMQDALSPVVLVRVNALVFERELTTLHYRTAEKPGLYLLASDASPRDGILGNEWDEDTPANMAPVLKAFVRGKYSARRHKFTPNGTMM